ncbi:MAG: multiheme c-type cytochrome [Isosphaerales bacterium]
MPRIVPRFGIWLGVACGVLVLALVGVGLRWKGWRPGSDLLTQGAAAYSEGDWSRAADLARLRLKAAPEDAEALRLLARSTARLGRDVPANALFARMGSPALQAEDLFLLGLGLDRAGQREAAGRIWEKALRLGPDHAETIDQLIIRNTAQNRLTEAAQLAERLARLPGWEVRGGLTLGVLRAELSDPAGAVTTLRRALERPEAARLDRAASAHHRKLLARALLQTSSAGEARALLRTILDDGPDREASWLLSRAALLEGAAGDAAAALEAAGSYRAEHPLEAEPGPFAGEARCAHCHPEVVQTQRASRHSSTLPRGKQLAGLPYPDRSVVDPDDPAVTHRFRREGGRIRFETLANGNVSSAVVAYAFGSPDRYVSLVGPDDQGTPHILRLSHYQTGRDSGWVRTTGHSADAGGGNEVLGKPLDKADGITRCLFCHSTNPRSILDQSGPESADRGIGCERCHGPGELHLKAVAAKFTDPAIVSPAKATAGGRVRLCGQCHSYHQESPLPRTDSFWIRFQGTTLPWSRCYTESAGSLDCVTCHDPHQNAERNAEDYTAKCLACHSAGSNPPARVAGSTKADFGVRARLTCPVSPARGCVGCHMPPFRSEPLHATFADHYIRVHPDRKK